MRLASATLVSSLLLSACGSLLSGSVPSANHSPLISDATIRISPTYSLTVEKIVFGAAGAVLLYTLYDPLAPNWAIEEEAVGEDSYRLTLTMKRFFIGGEGEALAILRRWAEAVQAEGQYDGYRIERLEQGIESNTPFARRYAHATVRMTRAPFPDLPAVQIARADPMAPVDVTAGPERGAMVAESVVPETTEAVTAQAEQQPLPRPAPIPGGQVDWEPLDAQDKPAPVAAAPNAEQSRRLPRPPPIGVNQVMLNARVMFDFDSARLTQAGRQALEREVVANRAELGRFSVLIVSGHTDRIGSYAYNQRLSEARAKAVREFLVERGFDQSRVVSIGYGKTRPLAGFPCAETMPRGSLIECLAPQRRVELDFQTQSGLN